jgi:hypothetical protein
MVFVGRSLTSLFILIYMPILSNYLYVFGEERQGKGVGDHWKYVGINWYKFGICMSEHDWPGYSEFD